MKKSELRQLIKEILREETKRNDITKIYDATGNGWWLVNGGDGYHLYMVLDKPGLDTKDVNKLKSQGGVYHIGQLKPFSYYYDVRDWLDGKKDINGNKYKN